MSPFSISDRLADGLRAADAGTRPVFELAAAGHPLCDDLATVPANAEYISIQGTAAGLSWLTTAPRLTAVWASAVTPQLLRALAGAAQLRALSLYDVGKTDLAPVGQLSTVEHLLIGWAPHLVDVSWLRHLPKLRTLYLEDMKHLDLETLPELPHLQALHIGGGMWSTLKVGSFAPLGRAPNLRYLALSNVRSADGSLASLASLTHLRELLVPNFFSVEECAHLAASLPDVDGQILRPIFMEAKDDALGKATFPCGKCGGSRLMLTGRPALMLCPQCDAARIAKRVARWEVARAVTVGPP